MREFFRKKARNIQNGWPAIFSMHLKSSWMLSGLRQLFHRAEVDRAVALSVLARTWSVVTSPVTLLLIVSHLTPELQGYYYTFGSLLALQSFVELDFYMVIIQFTSHEWAHLGLNSAGRIVGDPDALSRLVSLGRFAFKWYAVVSGIFVTGMSTVGYIFFSHNPHPGVDWVSPWFTLVLLTGLRLWMLPLLSILEGCNQVTNVYLFRFFQAIVSTIVIWLSLALGGELWVASVSLGVGLLVNLSLLWRYRLFFQPFLLPPDGACMSWRTELWPMQWRFGGNGLVAYFAFSLFTPVMFYYHGATVAGQMGMAQALIDAVQAIAMAWVTTRVPSFGVHIAKKQYAILDRLYFRTFKVSMAVITSSAAALWLLVYALNVIQHPLSQRVLQPLPMSLFLLAAILQQISACQGYYLVAHKQNPLLVLGVVSSLAIGLFVWLLGSRFGPVGAATGYLAVVALLIVPWITVLWFRYHTAWHQA